MLNYLGIELNAYGGFQEIHRVSGEGNNFANGLDFILRGGIDAHYYVDGLLPTTGEPLLTSEYDTVRMVANETEDYKCISSSLIFGAIANGDSLNLKAYLMSEIVDHLLGISVFTNIKEESKQEEILLKTYPNPCKDKFNIEYYLSKRQNIRIDIYNAAGSLVKVILDREQAPGSYSVSWDATDVNGHKLQAGLYFYRIESEYRTRSGKIMLVK